MRARQPDSEGYVERDGVKVFYEVFGAGEPTILLMPSWSVVHSRTWKMQVPFLARHYRVITFDGRGNGRSDRPAGADSYLSAEYAADALAVMDATDTERAVVVSLSRGASYSLHLAAARPERVVGQVFICPTTPLAPVSPARLPYARSDSRSSLTATRAGRRTTPATGSGTTVGSWSSSSPRCSPSRTRPSPSRTASAGGLRPRPRHSATRGGERSATRTLTWRRCSPVSGARAWSSRAPTTRSSAPTPAPGWPKPWAAGPGWSSWPDRATPPMPATRSRSTCSSASSSTRSQAARGDAEALEPRPQPPEAGSVHLLPDRAWPRPPGHGHRR